MRRTLSLIAALALTLSMAAPSLAATEGTTTESLTILTTTSLTGVPASIAWGTGLREQRTTANIVLGVETDNPSGFNVTLAVANMTNGSGGTIAPGAHRLQVAGSSGIAPNATYGTTANWGGAAGTPVSIASKSSAQVAGTVTLSNLALSPGSAPPGTYTGSMVFSLNTNP